MNPPSLLLTLCISVTLHSYIISICEIKFVMIFFSRCGDQAFPKLSMWIIRCNETNHSFRKHVGTIFWCDAHSLNDSDNFCDQQINFIFVFLPFTSQNKPRKWLTLRLTNFTRRVYSNIDSDKGLPGTSNVYTGLFYTFNDWRYQCNIVKSV